MPRRKTMLAVVAGIALGVAPAQAGPGPIGTYYLTDHSSNGDHGDRIVAIQGLTIVENDGVSNYCGPIAVFSGAGVIRTTGFSGTSIGGEYQGVPGLTVTPDGNTFRNPLPPDVGLTPDGTTDGSRNYTVEVNQGRVYAMTTTWGGASLLFTTGHYADAGITYDALNNSLWIANRSSNLVTDYTLGGAVIFTFSTSPHQGGDISALAMDVDHTLWMAGNGGFLLHFTTGGTFLGETDYAGLVTPFGGEIAPLGLSTPEPATFASAAGIVLISMAFARRSRDRNREVVTS